MCPFFLFDWDKYRQRSLWLLWLLPMFQHQRYFLACVNTKYELIDLKLCIVLLVWCLLLGFQRKRNLLCRPNLGAGHCKPQKLEVFVKKIYDNVSRYWPWWSVQLSKFFLVLSVCAGTFACLIEFLIFMSLLFHDFCWKIK